MEVGSVAPVAAKRDKRVRFGTPQVVGVVIGVVVAAVSVALKGFNVPSGANWTQSTSYISTGDGKVVIAAAVIGLLFLLLALAIHRKGVLWGTYICSLPVIALPAIIIGVKFTLVGAGADGGDVKASAAIAVYVALVGGLIILISAIAARQSARPLHG